jgi:hypothetical protein
MNWNCNRLFRRWAIFGPGVIVSVLPAFLLTNAFAEPGRYSDTLRAFWIAVLIGPVKYWFSEVFGDAPKYALHPMSGTSLWVYAVCFALTLAHPIKPQLLTAWITVGGFAIWYGWAFLMIAAVEY